jgi:hypothetical protein
MLQPSETIPHSAPICTHVFGVQSFRPHVLGAPPPPQNSSGHTPHWMLAPQPSGTWPHLAPT